MIVSPARQIVYQASKRADRDTLSSASTDGEAAPFEQVGQTTASDAPQERRTTELRANAHALHLGIAAQMWSTQPLEDDALLLPLPPVARTAARYTSTAQGLDQATSMGFTRTA